MKKSTKPNSRRQPRRSRSSRRKPQPVAGQVFDLRAQTLDAFWAGLRFATSSPEGIES